GSAAYAVGEAFGWHVGLSRKFHRAKSFYAVIAISMLLGAALNFTRIDPIKALFWSAVINGVVAVPVMVLMMLMGGQASIMGDFTLSRGKKIMGWLGTIVMAAAAIGMFATWNA
ncbi:MAG TPA: divalent metal cation transporter, partial [Caulobacteraceae bacterium]|nr:divalent metal cation transporter [Caulobacteraceae bacterium]